MSERDFYRRMSERKDTKPLSNATDAEIAAMGDKAFDQAVQEEADGWLEGYEPSSFMWRKPNSPPCSKCYRWGRCPPGQRHFGYVYSRICDRSCECAHHASEIWLAAAAS